MVKRRWRLAAPARDQLGGRGGSELPLVEVPKAPDRRGVAKGGAIESIQPLHFSIVAPRLGAVAAVLHAAPPARSVPALVHEQPAASGGLPHPAQLDGRAVVTGE